MKTLAVSALIALLVALSLSGCVAPPPSSAARAPNVPSVRELPMKFVAPESCTRGEDGWLVSEQGCGYEQPCREAHGPLGRVVLVRDDGTREDLLTELIEPKGVDFDAGGNLWVAHKGEFVVRTTSGAEIRTPIPGSGLLNDVAAAGASSALVSDSVTGKVHRATLTAGRVTIEEAFTMSGAPNGLAVSADVVAVAGLGDLKVPGLAGWIRLVGPGGEVQDLPAPPERKFDGIVPWRSGFLFSSVYSRTLGRNDTTLWSTVPGGGPARLVFDAAPFGLKSAADIGIDRASGVVCVPDLNGSAGLTTDGAAGAKVLIVSGLR